MKKVKKVVDRDSILEEFDSVNTLIESEIENIRSNNKAGVSTKVLRNLIKCLKSLRSKCAKVMKKKKTVRKNNSTSGFLKPVNISSDMAKFTGWAVDDLKSRVEVTQYICNYIKENDLQNPADRREIKPDTKLKKLLGIKPGDDSLKYYSLQTYLKSHFPKK